MFADKKSNILMKSASLHKYRYADPQTEARSSENKTLWEQRICFSDLHTSSDLQSPEEDVIT